MVYEEVPALAEVVQRIESSLRAGAVEESIALVDEARAVCGSDVEKSRHLEILSEFMKLLEAKQALDRAQMGLSFGL